MYSPNDFIRDQTWIDKWPLNELSSLRTAQTPASLSLHAQLVHWRRFGFLILKNVVSRDLIDLYREELSAIRSSPRSHQVSVEVQGKQLWSTDLHPEDIEKPGTKLNHLHTGSAHAARIALSEAITRFLGAIFESPPVPMQSLTFIRGSQQPTHIDYPYVRQQLRIPYMAAAWIPLETTSPDAGPLAYFPQGHLPKFSGFFDWGAGDILSRPETKIRNGMDFAAYLDRRMAEAGISPSVLLPEVGDVLLWHCNLPHQGTPINDLDLTRLSMVVHYTGRQDYPPRWIQRDEAGQVQAFQENGAYLVDFPWSRPEWKLPSWRLLDFQNTHFSQS